MSTRRHVSYIELASRVSQPLLPLPIATLAPPARLAKPLAGSRVMLVSTAGVHRKADQPFGHINDLSYRMLPQDIAPEAIRPSHPSPIRRPGLIDVNAVFPYQPLADLANERYTAAPTESHVSLAGRDQAAACAGDRACARHRGGGTQRLRERRAAGAVVTGVPSVRGADRQGAGARGYPNRDALQRLRHTRARQSAANGVPRLPARQRGWPSGRRGRAAQHPARRFASARDGGEAWRGRGAAAALARPGLGREAQCAYEAEAHIVIRQREEGEYDTDASLGERTHYAGREVSEVAGLV